MSEMDAQAKKNKDELDKFFERYLSDSKKLRQGQLEDSRKEEYEKIYTMETPQKYYPLRLVDEFDRELRSTES
jgi:hypothetical protein